ncbi:hypothetical protein ACFWMP_25725 [Paenibacillus sp. NPDC058367]|uniref:hypothetical protein n=1 Tax=Paenibacillus sp. NPDC058367 TaxID=3346460 RepID=UPI0036643676
MITHIYQKSQNSPLNNSATNNFGGISSGGGAPEFLREGGVATEFDKMRFLSNEPVLWTHPGSDDPQLLIGNLYYRRPSPAQDWEINREATAALEYVGKKIVEGWAGAPGAGRYEFDHVELLRIENMYTQTNHNSWTGVRHWEVKGTPIGKLYYRVV